MASADVSKKRKRKEYIYGNYEHYYGYRVGRTLEEDPRVSVFRKEWIQGKECLDIGCNEGHVTIAVAVKYGCKSMQGVDIDSKLVFKARKNLKLELEALAASENGRSHAEKLESAGGPTKLAEKGKEGSNGESQEIGMAQTPVNGGAAPANHENEEAAADGKEERQERENGEGLAVEEHAELLRSITFRTQNYLEGACRAQAYDTIFCLSISKWIHLNWGDKGLIEFFSKIFKELRPGGVLVFEPQPWKSYGKKRKVSEVATKNFKEAVLRPEDFPNLLTEKIGFKSFEVINSELPSSKDGFKRPLFAYYK